MGRLTILCRVLRVPLMTVPKAVKPCWSRNVLSVRLTNHSSVPLFGSVWPVEADAPSAMAIAAVAGTTWLAASDIASRTMAMLECAAQGEFPLEDLCRHAVGVTGALHHRPAGGAFAAHEERDAQQAFVARDRDFRG